MSAVIGIQLLVLCLVASVTAAFWGSVQAVHLVLGGLAAWVPNALFALRLALSRHQRPESGPVIFFVGEFAKIGVTVGLMALTVLNVPDLNWLAWLVGLIVVVKAQLLLGVRALI
ncbi:MAG: hypothetical protein RL322_2066 [Pseudomonadota bacterium]|jgi:ATP synthase protein I